MYWYIPGRISSDEQWQLHFRRFYIVFIIHHHWMKNKATLAKQSIWRIPSAHGFPCWHPSTWTDSAKVLSPAHSSPAIYYWPFPFNACMVLKKVEPLLQAPLHCSSVLWDQVLAQTSFPTLFSLPVCGSTSSTASIFSFLNYLHTPSIFTVTPVIVLLYSRQIYVIILYVW